MDQCCWLRPANRYGELAELPTFQEGGWFFFTNVFSFQKLNSFGDWGHHVPTLALINPMSGAAAGMDILSVARRCDYYKAGSLFVDCLPYQLVVELMVMVGGLPFGEIPIHDPFHSKFLG